MKRVRKILPMFFLLIILMIVPDAEASAATKVQGRLFYATMKTTTTVKLTGSKKRVKVKAGTKVVVRGRGTSVPCTMAGGKKFKINSKKLRYTGLKTSKKTYSKNVKENFVNKRGYSSKTKYLIWINQYTCNTTIFKGSKGKWKMVRSMICVIGKGSDSGGTTPVGVYKLCRRDYAYGMPRVYFTWNSSKGWGNSFHRRINSVTRGPASHGCIRLGDSDLSYLVNHCKLGTTVVSY